MSLGFSRRLLASMLLYFYLFLGLCILPACGQMGSQGTVSVTVLDQSGGVIPDANLTLQDLSTNDIRTAVTQSAGTYTFVGLSLGRYKLTVSKSGFKSEVLDTITVQAARVTDVKVTLQVGAIAQKVEVSATATPLMEATSNGLSATIDLRQIEDLPLYGRDVSEMATIVAGYNGTWEGLPEAALGNNIDGVIAAPNRMKFVGNSVPVLQARLEDIQEMTIQSDQLDLNTGYGQASMQINFVTRRGTNDFHGRLYEDHRNAALNANSWSNNAYGLAKAPLIMNDFGGSVGGPIIKNKLFFFGSFAMFKQPGAAVAGPNPVLTTAAQSGVMTFVDNSGTTQQVNVLTQIAQPNGLPFAVNSQVSSQMAAINSSLASGAVAATSDPNINNITWLNNSPLTYYFPAFRLDYNVRESLRANFAWNDTKEIHPNTTVAEFPGSAFANRIASFKSNNYTPALGVDWTIRPNLVNQLHGGFLYNAAWNSTGAAPLWDTQPQINWAVANSGQWFNPPITTYYPLVNFADNMNWVHGAHSLNFGGSFIREQDHYWNAPLGYPVYQVGLDPSDPASSIFATSPLLANAANYATVLSEAQGLYATLVGRIQNITGSYYLDEKTKQFYHTVGQYNLDELQKQWGLFVQDSYRYKPTLTLNYGLRWDFTGDDHDLTGAYHSPEPAGIWGPTTLGHIFRPGDLNGDPNPTYVGRSRVYNPWNVSPQPAVGVAWNPKYTDGLKGKLLGGGNTVVRAGASVRRYTESNQFIWNSASNYGFGYTQTFSLYPSTSGTAGTFQPGSLALGSTLPPYYLSPTTYENAMPESDETFYGYWAGVNGIMPSIRQPYVMSWNFGIQRALGQNNVLEVRYVGSRSVHQWIQLNPNEVNIYENGFLNEFKNAQANLAINTAHGVSSFANNGYSGQQNLPIMTAASPGYSSGSAGFFTDGTMINYLKNGQAGDFATLLAGTQSYLCNLIGGATFSPCAGYAGAGFPINFFQTNPFNAGKATPLMTDAGWGNYHALQVDLREKPWHGAQFDVNYTWSHTLGVQPGNDWTGSFYMFSMRDLRLSYGPTLYDLRHVLHANGTYNFPFGKGKRFANRGGIVDKVIGGWTVGTIVTYQSGAPSLLQGGWNTTNGPEYYPTGYRYGDGGVTLTGVTGSQLQKSVGVYHTGLPFADALNPQYLHSPTGGGANPSFINPNTTAGVFGYHPWLFGPRYFNQDMAITKSIPIRENVRFTLQGEFLNAWNHPTWGYLDTGVQDYAFGEEYINNSPRNIELRANIEF